MGKSPTGGAAITAERGSNALGPSNGSANNAAAPSANAPATSQTVRVPGVDVKHPSSAFDEFLSVEPDSGPTDPQKYNPPMLSVVVQAGGQSQRMGENKALKQFLGRPLIERVVSRLRPIADELILTTNDPATYEFIQARKTPDLLPGLGPLGGLLTAMDSAQFETVAVVACDMPFACASLLTAAADILREDGVDVVIAESPEGFEPMHAVYRRQTCLPAIQAAIDAGQRRAISWFPAVKLRQLTPQELKQHDPEGLAFWNVNTPEEFADAERRASTADAD